jgi:hypothetical protein
MNVFARKFNHIVNKALCLQRKYSLVYGESRRVITHGAHSVSSNIFPLCPALYRTTELYYTFTSLHFLINDVSVSTVYRMDGVLFIKLINALLLMRSVINNNPPPCLRHHKMVENHNHDVKEEKTRDRDKGTGTETTDQQGSG